MDNFDVLTNIADKTKVTNGDLTAASVMAVQNPNIVGDITRFYRSVVGYDPDPNPDTRN